MSRLGSGMLQGVRVVELAEFMFVPSAGAILAEWGADVIKVEHPVRGDSQRGFVGVGGQPISPLSNPMIAHANRGKRSIGIDIATVEGRALLLELARTTDVITTSFLPQTRTKLKIDVEDFRAVNPHVIYARGSAFGDKGPDRQRGGFDGNAFWAHSGIGYSMTPAEFDMPLALRIGGFGDSIAGMNLAGGIVAALLHRDRTGAATEIDVSLLSSAWWALGGAIAIASATGRVMHNAAPAAGGAPNNPFLGDYRTADGRAITLFILKPGQYIRETFERLGLDELVSDPRFADGVSLMANAAAASEHVARAFEAHPLSYWRDRLRTFTGQWAAVQSALDLTCDAQALANDMIVAPAGDAEDRRPGLVRGPVQFDHAPAAAARSPEAFEHTEELLLDLGLDWERIAELQSAGIVS